VLSASPGNERTEATPAASQPPTASTGTASFGIVVTTIGRVSPLEALLDSLLAQTSRPRSVAVCVQGNLADIQHMLLRRDDLAPLGVVVTTSDRGASLGRNVAARALDHTAEYLLFPNDTTIYPPDFLADLASRIGTSRAGCVTVVDEQGPKFTLPDDRLSRDNAWNVILPGLVVRADVFDELGGFDEELGTGAATPWQSGEETDIVLRLLEQDRDAEFLWMGELSVGGISDSLALSMAERRRKLRGYGRGLGRVLVLHHYPVKNRARVLLGGLVFGLRHRAGFCPSDGWWVFLGRAEGLAGRTLGGTGAMKAGEHAVDR
jgi:hypothetical protein